MHFLDYSGALFDDGLLDGFADLDDSAVGRGDVRLGRFPVHRPAIHADVFLAQVYAFLDGLLRHTAVHPNAAALNRPLSDPNLFLNHRKMFMNIAADVRSPVVGEV